MPLYRITAPNGQTYQIEGPDGASDAAVAQAVMAQYPESGQPAAKKSTIGSELKRGAQQMASGVQTAYGAVTGSPEEAAKAGIERGQAISQVAGEGVGFEPVKRAYQEKGLLSAAGELASQVPRALAGQGANLAAMAGGARLGAMAGSAVAPGPGTLIGGALGAGAALLPQLFGSNVETQAAAQMERGEPVKIDRTKAGVAAAGQAALEGAGAAFTLGKGIVKGVLGIADDAAVTSAKAAQQLQATAQRSLTASAGRGAARGVVVEMPVEVAQQVIERAQAGQDLTSKEAFEAYGDAAYQAGLVGGPLGAAGNVVNRGQAKERVAAKAAADAAAQAEQDAAAAKAAQEAAAQPKLPMVVAPGTQGALFTPEEMGKPVPAPKAPAEPTAAAVPAGQEDLGLDFQREYADMAKESERLKQQPQTPETKARVAELADQMALYTQSDIESIRAEAEGKAAREKEAADTAQRFPALANAPDLITQPDEVKGRTQGELFPGEDLGTAPAAEPIAEPTLRAKKETGPTQRPLGLRRNPEGQPTTFGEPEPTITSADIMLTAIPVPKGVEGWLTKNVVGSTRTQLDALIAKDPTLVEGSTPRAKILRSLTAADVPAFKETPRVKPTPTPPPTVEQRDESRAGKPSVGVPSEPAAPVVPEPGAGAPVTAEAPATPDGRGLVPAGRPAVPGDETAVGEPAAVTPPVERTADVVQAEVRALEAEQQTLLTKAGRVPVVKSPARAKWDALDAQIAQKKEERDTLDRAERKAKVPKAPKVEPKAPAPAAPAVEAETDAEEAARKAEAEDFNRRLEALEKAKPAAPKAAPAPTPAPKAEKPEPKEIPEKLREPVGKTDFGGEDTILRGPQGMLFPMSKREETEYAKAKEAEANKEEELEVEPTTLKDERQGELDLRAPRKAAAKATTKKATPAPAQPTSVAPTKEITSTADTWGGTVEFFDGTVGVIKRPHPANGEIQYIPIRADGTFARNLFGVQSVDTLQAAGQNKVFSPAEMATLVTQTADSKAKDTAAEAKFPDGPFTGASSNVVAGKSVDPRYTNYLTDLMKSLGLGDVRVFLYHSADVAGNADKLHIHGSYYPIMARGVAKDSQKGATKPIGPDGKDFMLFVNDNMSEAQALEVIAHELGHMIEKIAYTSAPANVRDAIIDEYDAWLASLKGKKASDLVASLRNRNMAEDMEQQGGLDVELSKLSAQDKKYWLGFDEWFADNVSRWATTADKPLTITEKFFSRVGQMMRDLVAVVTGRKFPPNKAVADFLNAMGPGSADLWMSKAQPARGQVQPLQNAVSFSTESLINGMGPIDQQEKPMLRKVIDGFKAQDDIGYATKFRTQTADAAATIENRLRNDFDGAVKDKLGKFNPMGLYRQAQDYSKMLLEYMQVGAISKEPATGLWKVKADPKVRPPVEVYALIDKWAAKNGYSRERGTQIASRVLEGVRLDAMRASNKNDGTSFLLHLEDNEIDQLVREYKADPDLQAMSKAMDEARIAMVDNMVAVGRLTKETGDVWKDTVGYVPFDRLEDEKFAAAFSKVKKISNKGLAQVGKLPELVGSEQRPVGNVFDNYLNTLGWMVGQTMKTDATVRTLRSLEDAGHAKYLGRSAQQKPNTVGMYVDGEMMYWELPSKYDVLAFKDLNPPKAKWLQILGQASNVLRKAVTVLPPFALKQVTDDVQRAIMTSGVKNPGALLRMTLSNFGGLALAELRGIQHPTVKQFGALGLTGEYDFQQGKPATSVLKDLGYKPRGKVETLIHRLDGITRASDLAVRKAIYDQTMKESQGDALLAQTRAREFINFRRRGASDFVGAMVTTIPFFNAYIQGMDVLYRAASGKDSSSSVGRAQARRMFYSRAAIAMTLSSLYALGKGDDDEDYNEMDLRTRDSNWILPGGFKLPVPTELGALFKVIPERIVEYMRRQGTPEEQEAWEATRTALTYIMEQYVGRVVPVPQGVKPLLEAWTNYSFFTGRELEGIYQKQQDPSLRRASNTSELAIAIANFSKDVIGVDKVSPILIDNALSGYFGSTAGLLVAMTDSLLNPTRVDRPLHKYALIANYMYDPVGTRRMTEFYDEREKVGRANTTLRELMKTDMDKAAEYAEKNADKLMLESAVNSTLEQLERTRAYRKYLNGPLSAEEMSKEEREATIKEVKQMEVQLTSWLREAKTAVRQ